LCFFFLFCCWHWALAFLNCHLLMAEWQGRGRRKVVCPVGPCCAVVGPCVCVCVPPQILMESNSWVKAQHRNTRNKANTMKLWAHNELRHRGQVSLLTQYKLISFLYNRLLSFLPSCFSCWNFDRNHFETWFLNGKEKIRFSRTFFFYFFTF
jgi:hypothetical protein